MNPHESPRGSVSQLTTPQEDRLRAAGLALRQRGTQTAPVTTAWAARRARRHRILTATGIGMVVAVALATGLGLQGGGSTVRTGPARGNRPPTAGRAAAHFGWQTPTVSLTADAVRIVAGGQTFSPAAGSATDAHSDPGNPPPSGYTTLELGWTEHGVEMRMNIYFASDAQRWWASEIRVYNGKPGRAADWVTFDGRWFDTPLGQAFRGPLELATSGASLRIDGLQLVAFLRPAACETHQTRDALENLYPVVHMGLPPSGYGIAVRLYDSSCTLITDLSGVSFTWTADDPAIVTVSGTPGAPTSAALTGRRAGTTLVRVVARDRATGAVLATTSSEVQVSS